MQLSDAEIFRALYVEDNALDADLARRALAAARPPVVLDVVPTVAQALQALRPGGPRYDWVLFDLTLPDGDGLEVLGHVRTQRLPAATVAVTGTGDERTVMRALKLGVDDYLIKAGDYLAQLPAVLLGARERLLQRVRRRERPIHVVYAEDNSQDGDLTRRHLAAHAPHLLCEVVQGGREDIGARLAAGRCDVLLLDYQLDGLDAFDLLHDARQACGPDLPVVIVTGRGSEEVAVQALRLGVTDYVVKEGDYLQRLPAVLESAHVRAELQRGADRLRASEARLQHLTRQVPGAIAVLRLTPDGGAELQHATRLANPGLGSVLLRGVEHALRELVHPDDRSALRRVLEGALHGAAPVRCEYRVVAEAAGLPPGASAGTGHTVDTGDADDTGRWRWIETQFTPEPQADGSALLYTYSFDISARKRYADLALAAQSAERASLAKTEFLSRMSHELRTPLNAVLGFAQLLQADPAEPVSARQRRSLELIERAGLHLLEMINDILDLSRIEAGQMAMQIAAQDPLRVCEDALALVAPAAQQREVRVSIEATGAEGLSVAADPLRLRQVLVNLLSNAVKYNHHGGRVTVSFESRQAAEPAAPEGGAAGPRVGIRVADTGPGLSAEQQAQLFQPFNRLGAERSGVEGTGIGLVIVRRLVEMMAGQLELRSEPGCGSCFTVWLPVAGGPGLAAGPAAPGTHPAVLPRVLYAEDDPTNVELVTQILLSLARVQVQVARNGAEAIARALADPPDLLLLDMHLGDMDGIAVSDALRRDERLAAVPRVALSADAMPAQIRRARESGFADYLTKPVDVMELTACLGRHLPRPVT